MAKGISKSLLLKVLGRNVSVRCEDTRALTLLAVTYGYMQGNLEPADLNYRISKQKASSAFVIERTGREPSTALDESELLFLFEKDMTVELQRCRRDLYFVHSAVVGFAGKAFMLVAPSGYGKSTLTWGLLHHGFRYLSDELGPVDLKTLEVYPYPHALCLKDEPPPSYPLTEQTLYTSHTLHVPVESLPGGVGRSPTPLGGIFFLERLRETVTPAVLPVSVAEASARLYANALNPLAHSGDGLDGAMEIAKKIACFKLFTAELSATCALLRVALEQPSVGHTGMFSQASL